LSIPALTALGATALPFAVDTVSAHAAMVSGTAVCQANGTYTISWKIENDFNESVDITLDASTGGGTLTGLPTTIAGSPGTPYQSGTATQSGVPGSATSASLGVHATWADDYEADASGSLGLAGDCTATTSTTTSTTSTTTSTTSTTTTAPDTSTTSTSTPGSEPTTTLAKTLTFDVLGPICVADHPYIHWTITATGLTPQQNRATITISDVDGNVVETLTDQPFDGQTLWPGASLDPEDWPGWVKIGGVWYTDPTDSVLRQGVMVRADVNPTAGPQLVTYPAATAACAGPETDSVVPDGPGLPVTGHGIDVTWMAIAFVGVGCLLVLVTRRRWRH
jgi:hypothetical protein